MAEVACWSAVLCVSNETSPSAAEHGTELGGCSRSAINDVRARTKTGTNFSSWDDEKVAG